MPINNITQTISELPAAGSRGVDVQTLFVSKQEDFQDHLQGTTVTELNTLKTQLNARIGEINSTATTMNGYATSASSSATTATTKAGEAATSATAALNSKTQASTSATNALNSATEASQWANNNYNVAVETGNYSAKHWATEAQNTVNTKVALTDFTGVNVSLTTSGFQKLPSGLIIQWGFGYAGSDGTLYTNYFPIAFPTGCVSVTANHEGLSNMNIVISQNSLASANFGARGWYSVDIVIRWIAIGF